jgi:hypothetical protein
MPLNLTALPPEALLSFMTVAGAVTVEFSDSIPEAKPAAKLLYIR